MIPVGKVQHLGWKAYALLVLEYVSPAIGIALVAALLTIFNEDVLRLLFSFQELMQPTNLLTTAEAAKYLAMLIFILLGLSLIAFFIGFIVATLVYHFYTFTLEEHDLRLKRGVLHREEISIPYRQMQNVNIIRSLFYQIIGVSKLYIDSAGYERPGTSDVSEIILQPIERDIAERVRSILQERIGVQIVEHSQP